MKPCLVLGAAGFVASNICIRLKELGYPFVAVDNLSFGDLKNVELDWQFRNLDVGELPAIYLNSFDVVISSFCSNIIYSQTNEVETFKNNAIKFMRMGHKFRGNIINLSTASIYNNAREIPTTESYPVHTVGAYDSSKLIAELFLKERGHSTTLRLSNVYGRNQRPSNPYCGVVGRMIDKALNEKAIEINGDGRDTRDFTFIGDVVEAVILAIEKPPLNDVINIATQRETSSMDLAKLICKTLNIPTHITYIDKRKIDTISRRCLSVLKAKELLGWEAKTDLEDGIKKTIEWQRKLKS